MCSSEDVLVLGADAIVVADGTVTIDYERIFFHTNSILDDVLDNHEAGLSGGKLLHLGVWYPFETSWNGRKITISNCALSSRDVLLALGFSEMDAFTVK